MTPFAEQLEQLASPVPDFAATLTTQAENDADDDNVSFLRGHSARRRPAFLTSDEFERINTDAQRRIRRAIAGLRRFNPEQRHDPGEGSNATYGNRVPHQQSLYDWAPASSDDEEEEESIGHPPRPQSDVAREERPRRRYHRSPEDMSLSSYRNLGPAPAYQSRGGSDATTAPAIPQAESYLRTTALLQSARRHTRFSTRSRINQLQNYILDRERAGEDREERERSASSRLYRPPDVIAASNHQQQQQQRELRARVDAYRQRYLENPSGNPPAVSRWLEEAIKYLERVRFSRSYEESLTSAAAGGFVREEFFTNNHEDFILDTASIDPPPESSWLKVGGVFSGSQHAANGSQSVLYRLSDRRNTTSSPSPLTNPNQHQSRTSRQHWLPSTDGPTITSTTSTATTTNNNNRTPHGDERWPVKVTIHSIDYSSMTLTGTMEAFNVPDKSSPTQESSITTFLEGEIIDFNTYTLETKSFKADARIDGTYWRKLEPFKHLTDDEIVRNLVSRRWLTEVLSRNWILMRWKGMYFTSPTFLRVVVCRLFVCLGLWMSIVY